jgi:hypothetical protein
MILYLRHMVLRLILIAVVGLMTINGAYSQLPGIFDPAKTVNQIVDELGGQLSALIAQAGGEARVTLLEGFQLSNSLIGSLKAAYSDSLNVTFDRLDSQQQKAFLDVQKLLDGLSKQLNQPVKVALQNWQDTNQILTDFSGLLTKKPLVMRYGPGYIPPVSSQLDKIRISIAGYRFQVEGVDPPQLTIGSSKFSPVDLTDVSVGFLVPRSIFPTLDKRTAFQHATLTFFRKPDNWLNWPWTKAQSVQFQLVFTILPEELGRFSSVNTIKVSKKAVKHFISEPDLKTSKEGGGGNTADDCYFPESGYKFDLPSARLRETVHLGRKDNDHSPGTNDGGISYRDGIKTEDRICIKVVAHTGCTECGATTAGHLEVDMVRSYTDVDKKETDSQPLFWKKQTPIPLVDDAVSQIINITLFDEIERVVVATSQQSLPFLSIDPDIRNHIVVLRPEANWSTN